MKIELTQDEVKFVLEMIDVLNFPGKVAETVATIKGKFKEGQIEKTKKVEQSNS